MFALLISEIVHTLAIAKIHIQIYVSLFFLQCMITNGERKCWFSNPGQLYQFLSHLLESCKRCFLTL